MEQNENRHIPFTDDLRINRLLNGMWQVSGAHGPIDRRKAIEVMLAYHDAGFTTWDLSDHYGPAEDFIGEFRRQLQTVRGMSYEMGGDQSVSGLHSARMLCGHYLNVQNIS